MDNVINITSRQSLDDVVNYFSPEEIDFFHSEKVTSKRGVSLYYISLGLKKVISTKELAKRLTELIIFKYDDKVIKDILTHHFINFSHKETEEIIETTQNSIAIFNQIYNKGVVVKNLTNLIEISNNVSLEGFLNFRVAEYKRVVQMIISDAIEQLFAKEEYRQFIEIFKSYISYLEPQIDLIHIKPNSDGSFIFYNFKMERIIFKIEETNPIEIFVTNQDMLMSILLTFVPKRIIWHDNPDIELENIKLTIEQIFDKRFSVCKGCELCKNKR